MTKNKHSQIKLPIKQPVKIDRILGFLLFAVTLAAYHPAWNGAPIWDDDAHITKPDLRTAAGLVRIWTEVGATQQYYPLVHTVFWLEHRLFGDATLGYHLLNILLHIFSALLLVTILRKLGLPGEAAWLAGGIFSLHPVMVESVAWISELKNTLSGVFFLTTALVYLKFDEKKEKKRYAIAFLLFIFGLLAKSVIATLPAVMLVVFWWKRGRIEWKRDVAPLLPFFIIGIFSGLFTALVERKLIGAVGSEFSYSIIDRCLIAGRVIWFYLYKLLWPSNLIFIYPKWHIDTTAVWQYLFPFTGLLTAVIFWVLRKRTRAPLAALLYFTAMLFPALGFFNVYPFRYSFVADHFQYLAGIGPIVAFAAIVVKGRSLLQKRLRPQTHPLLYVTLLSILFLLSWKQSEMYRDAETIYRITIKKNDNCWLAYNNLGLLLADKGRNDEAMSHFLKAIELNQNYSEAHNNLAILYEKIGRINEAIAHYQKALELNPKHAEAHNNIGLVLVKVGRTDEAMSNFLKAVEINPNNSNAHYNLGLLLMNLRRTDEAIVHLKKALELNPNNAETQNNLGILLAQSGHADEAMIHYQKALELNPNNAEAHNNLGSLLLQFGRTDEAINHYHKALEISPDAIGILQNLAIALVQNGQWTDASFIVQNALALARYTGDGARVNMISRILASLNESIDSSRSNLKMHAQ
jgi:protein O-mannosyl-transferase